jgi:hypothetical protein
MTLIAVYTSEGCSGRGDAKCYEGQEPHCDWICGGMNHGGGLAVAIDNIPCHAEVWLEKYASAHQLTEYRGELGQAVEQLDLF